MTFDSSSLRPSILLVEDEPIIRELIACALEDLGARVTAVETAAAGLRVLEEQRFALLLTDVRTPGPLNGLELAQIAARNYPQTKLIVTSGYHEAIGQALPKGATFLPKPWALEQLFQAIADQLAETQLPGMQPAA